MTQFDQRDQHVETQYNVGGDININLPPPPPDEPARRNRAAMLTLVEKTWITGVLEKSLPGAMLLPLGLKERPDAVQRPYQAHRSQSGRPEETPLHAPRLSDVFERAGGTLLLLGQPGAGKTTLLLDLTRDLIARARAHEQQPVPVVFNLSGWETAAGDLEAWLLEELRRQYGVGKRIAAPWLARNNICLLLDGLDEIATAEERERCVAAINAYREAHGPSLQLAVCSRTEEYERLTGRLRLTDAVAIQPLTGEQIEAYLDGAEVELQAVRRTLQIDPVLRELVDTPLMLNLMTAAYADKSLAELRSLATPAARRAHIFETYINEALARRPDGTYTPEQTRGWLVWLAKKMRGNSLTVFFIEGMQPSWLPTARSRLGYALAVRLTGGLLFVLAGGLGLLAALLLGFIVTGETSPDIGGEIGEGLLIGGVSGLAFVLSSLLALRLPGFAAAPAATGLIIGIGTLFDPLAGLWMGLFFGLPGSLAGLTIANPIKIDLDELVYWSWPRALAALSLGLVGGIGLNYLLGAADLANALAIGLITGLGTMLAFGSQRISVIEEALTPDKKLGHLRFQAGRVGLAFTLGCILFGAPIGLLEGNLMNGVSFGLIFGLPIGLAAALFFGGATYIQHLLLRLALWLQGEISLHLVHFLDYATACILLHRVGSGYSFTHRLLLEHFSQNNQLGDKK